MENAAVANMRALEFEYSHCVYKVACPEVTDSGS